MIKLENVDIKEFKKTIYTEYEKLFPNEERKPYKLLKKSYKLGITKIWKIVDNDRFVGFMIVNTLKDVRYAILDYFAILPQYQNNGYGTKAIELLKEQYKDYSGIFIEVEKVEEAKEDITKIKRVKFYERLGFYKLNCDIVLFTVLFSPYVLPNGNKKDEDKKIIEDIFEIYIAISGEKRVRKNCKVIYNTEKIGE